MTMPLLYFLLKEKTKKKNVPWSSDDDGIVVVVDDVDSLLIATGSIVLVAHFRPYPLSLTPLTWYHR